MAISPLKEATEIKAKYLPSDRIAIAWREKRLTWKEVDDRVNRLADSLHRLGVNKGETCAFLFYNQPEFIETTLAIQTLGAIPVPVNFHYVAEELSYLLRNCEATCFLFHQNALDMVRGIAPNLPRIRTYVCWGTQALPPEVLSYEALIASSNGHCPKADVTPEDTAVIIYTGGTTGRPKGVMLTYENFRSNQEAIFNYLINLLPPVEELPLPAFSRSELQRKILELFSHLTNPLVPILSRKAQSPPVVLLQVKGESGVDLPPLTVTLREGKPKMFVGRPPAYDFHLQIRMGDDFRKFVELSYYANTWRGKLAVIPQLGGMYLSGGLKTEGAVSDRLRMIFANLQTPHHEEIQHIALIPPLFHLASYAFWLTFWLYQNGMVFLPAGPEFKPDVVLDALEAERIAWLLLVPTMWKRCIKYLHDQPRELDALRVALTGAAVMPGTYKKEILRYFPNALVVDGFGQTEMAPVTTLKVDADPDTVKDRSVGRLLSGLEVKIANDDGDEVEVGSVGELWYRGPSVMKGYYGDEQKTREVLDADGWFHSGDLAFRGQDGEIYTVERKKECINTGGEKIFPQEVEEVCLSHPNVEDICIIGVPDDDWGETVRAVVVPKEGTSLTQEELIEWCRGKMATYKKPKSVVFCPSLPTSPVGKVLRAKVKELYGSS